SPELVKSGESLFLQQCAFCHGRDTGGGEDGPDLTRSRT
ncbi:MAG: cytochrome c class, partial [Candidatus Solibacter sp.]|nr:cytochrome c class [Candidatus Solibacter sp.]